MSALVAHQDLGERLPARAEIPIHDFQRSHLVHPAPLLDLRKHIRGKLMGGIVPLPLRVAETHVPGAQRKHDLAVGPRQRKDGVALVGIDVEVVCRRAVIYLTVHMGGNPAEQVGWWGVRLPILVAPDGIAQVGDRVLRWRRRDRFDKLRSWLLAEAL